MNRKPLHDQLMQVYGIKLDTALNLMMEHLDFNDEFHIECDDYIDECLKNHILNKHKPLD